MSLQKVLRIIAKQNGITEAHVRQEIQRALDEGWNSTDERVRTNWRKIPTKYQKPTMEEVVEFIINSIT